MISTSSELPRGLRILIVEDEVLIAEEIKTRLSKLGFAIVGIADTGEGAIALVESTRPDLILMDIRLKGRMDGIETVAAMRGRLAAPVVFLTAHSDHDTLARAKGTEPFGYVLKPFHERELVVAIELAIHRYGLEQRLKESEQKYAATLASIGDGVIATDPRGRVTFLNPVAEALTKWTLVEAKGTPIEQVFPVVSETDRVLRENPALEALRTRSIVTLTEPILLVTRTCDLIPIDDSASPILGEQGEILGAVLAFRDIRQRRLAEDSLRQAEEQLRQAQKMEAIGRLAGGIAHDFNNLLTVINGCSELLLDSKGIDETSKSLLGDINRAGERAALLTRQLLAFSRKQLLQTAEVNATTLLGGTVGMLKRLIGEDIELITNLAPDLWTIRADPSQIEQVVLNLAVNSRDAMPEGGQLTIETGNVTLSETEVATRAEVNPGRYVRLTVRDTGQGIDKETKERLFEPFFTTKGIGKGTGLGLATVYGIAKQAGGWIDCDSEVGKGATFSVHFPAIKTTTPTSSEAWPASGSFPGTETILLVEDEEPVRSLVAFTLRLQGYTIHEAADGETALRLLSEEAGAISMLLSDVVMPGMSGRQLAERVSAERPGIRVLFLSGYSDDELMQRGLAEGQIDLLEKPFTSNALAKKVREVLDR